MSTEYITDPILSEEKFLDVCSKHGIQKADSKDNTDQRYVIGSRDESNFIWVSVDQGYVSFSRYGRNSIEFLRDLEEQFEATIISEHDDLFMELLETQDVDRGYVIFTMSELEERMK